jgi:hypothetical protein
VQFTHIDLSHILTRDILVAKIKKLQGGKESASAKKASHVSKGGDAVGAAQTTATLDRRGRSDRRAVDRRKQAIPVAVERRKLERRVKVSRRRQIDPTTCERDYHDDEIEFMNALDQYKRTSGRMFPTCSEVLEVLRGLGYQKQPLPALQPVTDQPAIAQPIPTTDQTVPPNGTMAS